MRARLIKREEITHQSSRSAMQQNSHSQLEAQAPALTGIAAIRAEVEARVTTPERQKREQARTNFNDLFARLDQR
jgi:hypothetical protein